VFASAVDEVLMVDCSHLMAGVIALDSADEHSSCASYEMGLSTPMNRKSV